MLEKDPAVRLAGMDIAQRLLLHNRRRLEAVN